MGVAAHLGIDLADYDERIRTFIPHYAEMLDVAAEAIPRSARVIVDLGTGTGALAARCLEQAPKAHVIGIDCDGGMLAAASGRLQLRATFLTTDFTRCSIPGCDAAVASFALHHIKTRPAKAALYKRIYSALTRGGTFLTVDCHPAEDAKLAKEQHRAWKSHIEGHYDRVQAAMLLKAWSREDSYMPLNVELELMQRAGFTAETLWRKGAFAVLLGRR
jgi:tRNA (cmo5U34)-methyltransferase